MQVSALLFCWGSHCWACNLLDLIIYLFFLPVMLPSVLPRLTTDSAGRVFPGVWKPLFLRFPSWDGIPFLGWDSLPGMGFPSWDGTPFLGWDSLPGMELPPRLLCLFFSCFVIFPTCFWRQWFAFLGAWCPLPVFRSCFVEFAQRWNVLLMNLWGRKWSPHPIPLPSSHSSLNRTF